ncbi:RES family NAD+ phosphorylase [Proteus hauseri]|uniref:RES family NAD+ phosphorylase n=1 Tax=Proteus hauseri TaxID=183417 RepID=UPI0010096C61|nr:RES family NAD+ phosphorylase [Proteus hauseri]QAV25046.1 hypothetical protein PH4a_17565 [Proteus hauseri]
MVTKNNKSLYKKLNELELQGYIPYKTYKKLQQKRWQWKSSPSGIHYFTPNNPLEMGRYNDPSARTGVCYTANYAVIAIAESLGRIYQNNKAVIIGLSDLQKAQIYTLTITRKVKIIDMLRLSGILHITVDKMMGKNYGTTQAIVDWAANTPALNYDGISYPSRHYAGICTAFWARKEIIPPLIDVSVCSIDLYIDNKKENFPQNWVEKDISGIEIITETLKFNLNGDD